MNILYFVPGTMNERELKRRERIANSFVSSENHLDVKSHDSGPISIESAVEEEMSVSGLLRGLLKYQNQYDAAVLGCFGDPGLRAARELVKIPVIGPAESSISFSLQIADSFGILVALERDVPTARAMVARYEMSHKLAAIQPLSIPVLELAKNKRRTEKELMRAAELAESHGAECLILGCMSLAFLSADELIEGKVNVPLLNPAKIAIKTAEVFAQLKMHHSGKSYPAVNYAKLRKTVFKELRY